MEYGIHNVDTRWNGLAVAYETNVDGFSYRFEEMEQNEYEKNIEIPTGMCYQAHVVQSSGLDSSYDLPPLKTSTYGLQNTEPTVSNPYIMQRDASYAYADDCHPEYKSDGMFPTSKTLSVKDMPEPLDSFAPEQMLYEPWVLGEHDYESMFNDYFQDDMEAYMLHMDTATHNVQYHSSLAYGYAGAMNPIVEPAEYESVLDKSFHDQYHYQHQSKSIYSMTRESEEWNARELEDVTYHWLYDCFAQPDCLLPSSDEPGMHYDWVEEPQIIYVNDIKGVSTPMASGVMVVRDIQGKACSRLLKVLFDSGGSKSMVHRRVLPRGVRIDNSRDGTMLRTLAGVYHPLGTVQMRNLRLPAFDKNRIVSEHEFSVFDAACRYDVILGSDFLSKVGMNLNYKTLEVEWFGNTIPMESLHKPGQVAAHVESYLSQMEVDELGFDLDSYLADPILDAKYEKVDIDVVIDEHCSHLNDSQKEDLRALLRKHTKLFDGTLGEYPGEPMHIDIDPNATPVYRRPYPIPHAHLATFKKELDHLVELGVLSPVRDTEWGLPTFIVPKKDGRVRWVSDMRELNKVIKRTQYTLPIIQDELRKRKGYQFLTKLDISMQYYTFSLDEESKRLCTIVTPFGPYCYNRVPMGLTTSPGYAQARMEEILRCIEEVSVYIDDIGVFTDSWERHLTVLGKTLRILEDNNFTINPLKCEWAVKETDWLGYWLTPTGLKPWSKKVDAILKLQPPTNATELRTFLGMVTYYRDMWPRRSHLLKPLTALSGLKKRQKLVWTDEMDRAFKQMKALIAEDCLMLYPNHNLPFSIYTDASDYQIGACIMQEVDGIMKPVAYYSRKLTDTQRNYTTMEKELLAIVMVLKEYRTMLLGSDLNIYTDHKNLTFANFNTQRVLRWRMYVEEYSPQLYYLEGKLNVLADAFSRLPCFDNNDVEKHNGSTVPPVPIDDAYYSVHSESQLYECLRHHPDMDAYYESFLNLPDTDDNPMSYNWLRDTQETEQELMDQVNVPDSGYHLRPFGDTELVCYSPSGDTTSSDWKICLSQEALEPSIIWFHQFLNHPGRDRLLKGMNRFYHPQLRQTIERFRCDLCQHHKADGRALGKLPARDVRAAPWEQVDVDLIGPWKISTGTGKTYEFNALTSIDRVTGLPELIRLENKTSAHVSQKFEESWLSRYPRPLVCCHDNGGEFNGWEFQSLLSRLGIKDVPTTSRNPTANGIVERMHKSVADSLRTYIHGNTQARTLKDAQNVVDEALATAAHAVRANVHTTTGHSPGSLAFRRDMLLDIPLIVDLTAIRDIRQVSVDESLRRTNAKRSSYDYQIGQDILKKRHEWTKLGLRWDGPYTIQRVHCNGTVTIELTNGVTERINIRRIKPYHTPTVNFRQTMTAQNDANNVHEPEVTRPQRTRRQGYNPQTRGLTDGIRDGSYYYQFPPTSYI